MTKMTKKSCHIAKGQNLTIKTEVPRVGAGGGKKGQKHPQNDTLHSDQWAGKIGKTQKK